MTYSGVITAGSIARAVQHARQMRAIGIRHVKVKVGFDDDVARVTAVREALGADVSLRLDANGAWTFERAVARPERAGAARASPPSSSRCRGVRSATSARLRRRHRRAAHGRRVAGDAGRRRGAHRREGGGLLQRPRLEVRRPRSLAGHRRTRRSRGRRRPGRQPGGRDRDPRRGRPPPRRRAARGRLRRGLVRDAASHRGRQRRARAVRSPRRGAACSPAPASASASSRSGCAGAPSSSTSSPWRHDMAGLLRYSARGASSGRTTAPSRPRPGARPRPRRASSARS